MILLRGGIVKSVVGIILDVLAVSGIYLSQNSPKPSFEVATVKLDVSGEPGRRNAPMPNGRYVATRLTLRMLVSTAYGNQNVKLPSGTPWADTDLWDIEAKAPEGTVFNVGMMQDPSKADISALMMQSLLEERFQLKLHREMEQLPVYELTVAKSGLRMKLSEDQSPPTPPDFNAPWPQVVPQFESPGPQMWALRAVAQRASHIPLLTSPQGGVAERSRKCCEASFESEDGVVFRSAKRKTHYERTPLLWVVVERKRRQPFNVRALNPQRSVQ
jgi:hypothetical protein